MILVKSYIVRLRQLLQSVLEIHYWGAEMLRSFLVTLSWIVLISSNRCSFSFNFSFGDKK